MNHLSKTIVKKIRNVLGDESHPLHAPSFLGNEEKYVNECIKTTFVSSVGSYVNDFENKLAEYTGAKRAVAVVNGTSALQISLKLAGVEENDEVIVPAMTFVATANAVSYVGATPHFADIEEKTLGIDPKALRCWLNLTTEPSNNMFLNKKTGRRIKAIIPMHTFGHPSDLEGLLSVAHDFKLNLIEDSAESLGSFYNGKHTGTFGLFGTLSFNGNKIITTGGGGAILTNNNNLANYAKHLVTTAKKHHRWEYIHDEIGYNFRLPNINSALGCAQLENLKTFLKSKRRLFLMYKDTFKNMKDIEVFEEPKNCESNYWLQTLVLSNKVKNERDKILEELNNSGLMSRPCWKLINTLKPYKNCPSAPLPVSKNMVKRIINIPSNFRI